MTLPIVLEPGRVGNRTVRDVERASIREFVASCAEHLAGRVLDYGCGQQPYRAAVEDAGGTYEPFDRERFPGNVSGADVGPTWLRAGDYDAILCTQVAQYWASPRAKLRQLASLLAPGGHLVLTYPTTWAEVEPVDRWRFTREGMARLLEDAWLDVLRQQERAAIVLGGFRLPLGYGALARRPR